MGEAKRRRGAKTDNGGRISHADIEQAEQMMGDFFKGVATLTSAFSFPDNSSIGGECVRRTLIAYQATRASGIDAEIGVGGLLVRIGPDPMRDMVAFCNINNAGGMRPTGMAGFHCWLRCGDWIFDPNVGDWKRLDPVATEAAVGMPTTLGDAQWAIDLPRYWLKCACEVEAPWELRGTPELGRAWYTHLFGPREHVAEMAARICRTHEDIGVEIPRGVDHLHNKFAERRGIKRVRTSPVIP
jgi:hypothetical protein